MHERGPCRILAAPFDSDIPANTYLSEYAGLIMYLHEVEELYKTCPHLTKWIRWLLRKLLYINGCPVDFHEMAANDCLASIADHSTQPNARLEVKDTLLSQQTGAFPTLLLRSSCSIQRSTRDKLSVITWDYGDEDEKIHCIKPGLPFL